MLCQKSRTALPIVSGGEPTPVPFGLTAAVVLHLYGCIYFGIGGSVLGIEVVPVAQVLHASVYSGGTPELVAKADTPIERERVFHLRTLPFGRPTPRS
jgi:hypothetical protein